MRLALVVLLVILPMPALAQGVTLGQLNIGDWLPGISYVNGDLVKSNGTIWICNQTNCTVGQSPQTNVMQWNALSGLVAWDSATTYSPGQSVMRNGTWFTALVTTTPGSDPAGGSNPNWKTRSATAPPAILAATNNGTSLTEADIQAAIDAAPAGGIVQLVCATYTIGVSINIIKPLTLLGCNRAGTVFTVSGGVAAIVYSPASAGPLHVSHITFNGGAIGIQHNNLSNDSSVNESFFADQTTTGIQFNTGSSRWTVYHSNFTSSVAGLYGIQIAAPSTDNVEGSVVSSLFNLASGSTSSIESDGAGDLRIVNNKFLGFPAQAIHLVNTGSATTELAIVGNVISAHGAGNHGIVINPTSSLSGLTISGNQINSNGVIASSIRISGGQFGGLTISGNEFSDAASVATIDLSSVTQANITGNSFVSNGGSGIGILVGGSVTNTLIAANQFAGYGTNISGAGGAGTSIGVSSATCKNGIVVSGTGC